MAETGWIVSGVMATLTWATGIRDPLAIAWVVSTARFVYGADRFFDGTTVNEDSIESILLALTVSVGILYAKDMMLWSIPEVLSLVLYPSIKTNFPLYKPTHVGLCWTCAIGVVPQLIAANSVDAESCVVLFMLATAVSNYADIDDVDEDIQNGIRTLPVQHGRRKAVALSVALLSGSGLLFQNKWKRNTARSPKKQNNANNETKALQLLCPNALARHNRL